MGIITDPRNLYLMNCLWKTILTYLNLTGQN